MLIERDFYWDNLKAIAIYFVVLGHAIQQAGLLKTTFGEYAFASIYLWHMPLFVLISGYFTPDKNTAFKTLRLLVVPYVILEVVFGWTDVIFRGQSFEISLDQPNYGMWFLIALASWRLSWKFLKPIPYLLPLSIVLSLAVGYIEFIGVKYSLSRIICFFPFFILGDRLRQVGDMERVLAKAAKFIGLAIVAIAAAAVLYDVFDDLPSTYKWLYLRDPYFERGLPVWWAGFLRAAIYIGIAGALTLILTSVVRTKTSWTYIGQNTLNIYIMHIFVTETLRYLGMRDLLKAVNDIAPTLSWVLLIFGSFVTVVIFANDRVRCLCEWIYLPHEKLRSRFM